MKMDPYYVIMAPHITEESTLQSTTRNQYTFRVAPNANKHQIREAIEQMFPQVRVVHVNTMNYRGKLAGRRGRSRPGRRASWKKAVVTVREGDSLDFI